MHSTRIPRFLRTAAAARPTAFYFNWNQFHRPTERDSERAEETLQTAMGGLMVYTLDSPFPSTF